MYVNLAWHGTTPSRTVHRDSLQIAAAGSPDLWVLVIAMLPSLLGPKDQHDEAKS